MAEIIAKKSKPFSDGKFIKECFVQTADVFCPGKKKTFAKITLLRQTVARRVDELGNSIEENLVAKARNFLSYSLALWWETCSLRAKYGPLGISMRPACGWEEPYQFL